MQKIITMLAVAAVIGFSSCSDDDQAPVTTMSSISFENVTPVKDFAQSGKITNANGEGIAPQDSAVFTFNAGKGQCLQFTTMYGYSDDLFFAPANPGIRLYDDNGMALTGDVTDQVMLWDNGTRINQEPGQTATRPGEAENNPITMVGLSDPQGNNYSPITSMMKVMLYYDEASSMFTVSITNKSIATNNATPFSPGVWAISNMSNGSMINDKAFYEAGATSTPELTQLAEMGDPTSLYSTTEAKTGIITGISPAVVVIYTGDTNPIYQINTLDAGNGLKELAQTGDASVLEASLKALPNVKNVYVATGMGIAPGEMMQVMIEANPGDKLAYATMFGYSNDWFFSNRDMVDATIKTDLTANTILLDDGTSLDQFPGAGNAQALFGGTPIEESKAIMEVSTTYPMPAVNQFIKVTLQ